MTLLAPNHSTYPGPLALRAYYFCYLAAVGVAVPFFPPYLRGLGFSGQDIGWVLAVSPLMHMLGPVLWGWLTDRTQRPDVILRVALAGAAFTYLPLAWASGFVAVMAIQLSHQLFNIALPGLSDTLSLSRVKAAGDDYGRIRFWGSMGFVVSCLAAGQIFARRARGADPWLPFLVAGALTLALLLAFRVHGKGTHARPKLADAKLLIKDRRLLFILITGGVHWGCAAPYHGFFGVHVQDRGLGHQIISYAFALSVLSEMLTFFYFRHIRRRARLSTLLIIVTALSAVRWAITATVHNPVLLVVVQCLHGLTFGVFWASSLAWLSGCVPDNLRATGQTLFTGSVFGLGSLLGAVITGHVYEATGSAAPAFLGAAALNLLQAGTIALWGRKLSPEG